MINKKGVSIAISWVLLVGFAVTLALIVTVWMKSFADDATKGATEDVEIDIKCSEVSLNAIKTTPCQLNLTMDITNTGYFTIEKVKVRGTDTSTKEFEFQGAEPSLKPTQTKTLYTNTDYPSSTEITIIPIIKVDQRFVGCADRIIKISC